MRLEECRAKTGLRQQDVADILGISLQAYGSYERETRSLSFNRAIQLADLFGCTLDELAGRQVKRAEIVPMPETPIHARMRQTFTQLNHQGREALAEMADSFLRVPAFVDGGGEHKGRDTALQAAV